MPLIMEQFLQHACLYKTGRHCSRIQFCGRPLTAFRAGSSATGGAKGTRIRMPKAFRNSRQWQRTRTTSFLRPVIRPGAYRAPAGPKPIFTPGRVASRVQRTLLTNKVLWHALKDAPGLSRPFAATVARMKNGSVLRSISQPCCKVNGVSIGPKQLPILFWVPCYSYSIMGT